MAESGEHDEQGVHCIVPGAQDCALDVVYVHGLGGSSHSTWRHGKATGRDHFFWPEEIGRAVSKCAVWTVGYPAGFTQFGSPGMEIELRAGNLALQLVNAGIGDRPVVFVTHSMGGLVVKAMVVDSQVLPDPARKTLAKQTSGLVFIATPHRGSGFADAAALLGGLSQSHVKEMRANATALDTLHDRFVEWHRRNPVPIQSYAESIGLFRKRKLFRAVPLGLVVPRASANPGIAGHVVRDLDEDHIAIAKPASSVSPLFSDVERFIAQLSGLTLDAVAIQSPSESPVISKVGERVLISHTRADGHLASLLTTAICEFDPSAIVSSFIDSPTGSLVEESAIVPVDAKVVSLWSDSSVSSLWMEAEAEAGLNAGGLLSVSIDGASPPARFDHLKSIKAPDDVSVLAAEIWAWVVRAGGQQEVPERNVAPELDLRLIGPREHGTLRRAVLVAVSESGEGEYYAELQGFPELLVMEPTVEAAIESLVELLSETAGELREAPPTLSLTAELDELALKLERIVRHA